MIKSLFLNLCPNCGKDVDAYRLSKGLPCKNCMSSEDLVVSEAIEGELKKLYEIEKELINWEKIFENAIKSRPWSLQSLWAKRVFMKTSFALLAPTGVGKTSFGLTVALYLARKKEKSYIILPTKLLVEQVSRWLKTMGAIDEEILVMREESGKKKKEKIERLKKGDFLILVSTSMFLYKNVNIIPKNISFIFVDDVDSFLKTAKNIDKALYLLGFSEKDVQKAIYLIRLKEKTKKTEEDWKRIEELSKEVSEISNNSKGVLVVSSATSNPKSGRIKLFKELLGFEVGTPTFYLRRVNDLYSEDFSLSEWIKKLGKGGLVFIPSDMGKENINLIVQKLKKEGINPLPYENLNEENLKLYENGEIDVLIGIASYKNPLARGFDLPHVVRYAIFYGVPKIVISLKFEKNLLHLLWALASIRPHIAKKMSYSLKKIDYWMTRLRKYRYIENEQMGKILETDEKIERLRKEIEEFLTNPEVVQVIKNSDDITLRYENGEYFLVVSDATGYLQASGRTSRMYAGGSTEGLCITLIDDKKAFKHLQKKVKWFNENINFVQVDEVNLKEILERIDEDRQKVKSFMKGEISIERHDLLKPVLIIVESPNKARTIANFFGRPIRRKVGNHEVLETSIEDKYLMITSSYGHILDLTKNVGFHGVYINEDIVPAYEVIEGKKDIVESLRKLAYEASQILIATDPDTEGEKIGWDLMELLKPYAKDIKRMEFHEVTKKAILKALREPREFNLNLVKAQIVRRVSDRWVGFEFSRSIQEVFSKSWLSAGRVQTPVLGWTIHKEKEYEQKIYKVICSIGEGEKTLRFDLNFEDRKEADNFYKELKTVMVKVVDIKEETKNPPPPYSTDTLLKDANTIHKFSVPQIMQLAQTLFELGYITYHRTDSIRVSDYGMGIANEYIKEEAGKDYFYPRGWQEIGTHECIRPTKSIDAEELRSMILSGQFEGITKEHILLYDLIFRRFIASQTRPVKVEVATLMIKALNKEIKLNLTTKIIEDGWNRFLPFETHPLLEGVFQPRIEIRKFPKAFLYTQGDLIQEMKSKGIGRPSTYASIIEKLLDRGYLLEIKGFLVPTRLGKEVYRYLSSREDMKVFVSEDFTRELEHLMDMVEDGKADYQEILKNLYKSIIKIAHP